MMRASFIFILVASGLIAASGRAQTTGTNTNGAPPVRSTLIIQGPNGPMRITSSGTIQITPQNAPPASPGQPASSSQPDLFNTMISSAASVDMESPVVARAEFDPPVITAGGRTVYRVVVTALDESLKLPDQLPVPEGMTLTPGGRAQNYQPTGNGKLQPQTTINYRATATNAAGFTMPSFIAMAYGKPVTVPEAHLNVVPAGTPGLRDALQLGMELPEGDVYMGQTISVSVFLPDPGDGTVQGISQVRVNGDAIFSEPVSYGQRHELIRRDGRAYPAFVHEVSIAPMREGPQSLVAQASCMALRPVDGQPGAVQSASSLIDSDPVVLNVKPLPRDGRRPGFTGAIGAFQVEPPKLSTNSVRAGDPLTLLVMVRGEGNLGRLTPPQIPLLRDWQSFPPVGDAAPPFVVQQRGFARFSYTLIPLSEKLKATPAIPFSAFDPKAGAYADLTIPPVPLTVKPPPEGALVKTQVSAGDSDSDDPTSRERQLVMTGLAETPGWRAGSLVALQERGWFLALQLAPALAIFGLLAWDRRRRHLERHPEIVRKRLARRGLNRQLGAARRAAAAQDAAGFVNRSVDALRVACAPHAAANPDALVCADVLDELPPDERAGAGGEVIRRLFGAADAARFGGRVKDGSELLAMRPELERVLGELKAKL